MEAPSSGAATGVCANCSASFAWSTAEAAARAWVVASELEAPNRVAHDATLSALHQYRTAAEHYRLAAQRSSATEDQLGRAHAEAWRLRQDALALRPQPVEQARAAPATVAPRRAAPTAVLLQVVGAVLILAALVAASTALWTFVGPVAQAALLVGIVAALGLLSVAVSRWLAATAAVLAVLTVVAALVVVAAIGAVLPQLGAWRGYPTAGLVAVELAVAAGGRVPRMAVWRHAAIALLPVTVLVGIVTWPRWPEGGGTSGAPTLMAALAALAVVLARVGRDRSRRTSTTLRVTGMVAAGVGAGVGAVSLIPALAIGTEAGWRVAWSVGCWALAVWTAIEGRTVSDGPSALWLPREVPKALTASVGLVPLGVLLGPWAGIDAVPSLALGFLVGALVAAAVWLPARLGGPQLPAASVVPWWCAAAALMASFTLMSISAAVREEFRGWVWVAASAAGLLWAAAWWSMGVAMRRAGPLLAGAGIAVVVALGLWATAVTPDVPESWSWPAAAVLLATVEVGRRRIPSWGRLPDWVTVIVLAAGALPTAAEAWVSLARGDIAVGRDLAVIAVGAACVGLTAWRRGPWLPTAVSLAVLGLPYAIAAAAYVDQPPVELVSLPVAAALALLMIAACHDGLMAPRPATWSVAVVALVPSTLVSGVAVIAEGPVVSVRLISVAAAWALAAVADWAVCSARPLWLGSGARAGEPSRMSTVSWGVLVLLLAEIVVMAGVHRWVGTVEWLTAPAGVAAIAILWWVRFPRTAGQWWSQAAAVPVLAVLGVSTLWTLAYPAGQGRGPLFRVIVVVALWAALAVAYRDRGWRLVTFAGLAMAVAWVQWTTWVVQDRPDWVVEAITLPAAAGAAVVAGLVRRGGRRSLPTILLWGPAVALALWPTAFAAWSGPAWRVWLSLALGMAALVLGVHRGLGGLVWPGAVALLGVAIPIVVRLVSHAPAWLPLTIAGVLLLIAGARLEWLRRQGRTAVHWIAALK